MQKLERFISRAQLAAMNPELKQQAAKQLEDAPFFYSTDEQGKAAKVALHYFNSASDWFFTELNKDTAEAFGYCILNRDFQNAELGYSYIPELIAHGVELDLYWNTNTTLAEAIAEAENS